MNLSGFFKKTGRFVFLLCFLSTCFFQNEVTAQTEKFIATPDEAKIWIKISGPSGQAPTALFLHGGPGHNSYAFEKTMDRLLSKKIRLVYMDQRGGVGRSSATDKTEISIDAICQDIELVKNDLHLDKIDLIGHSFGGLIALEYLKRFPQSVRKIILIDISADLPTMISHQIETVAEIAPKVFPKELKKIQSIARSAKVPIRKLEDLYKTFTSRVIQRQTMFLSDQTQEQLINWDKELPEQTQVFHSRLIASLRKIKYMDDHHLDLRKKISTPAILFAGAKSHCVGMENIKKSALEWQIPLNVFENSGHFIFLDEPEKLAEKTISFLTN